MGTWKDEKGYAKYMEMVLTYFKQKVTYHAVLFKVVWLQQQQQQQQQQMQFLFFLSSNVWKKILNSEAS